jgi:hypothetical protein
MTKSEVDWSCFRSIPSKTGLREEMAWKTKDGFLAGSNVKTLYGDMDCYTQLCLDVFDINC